MLRPATPSALQRLVRAATRTDRELDAALIELGVLPPLDLDQIRGCLQMAPSGLTAGTNSDGHRLLSLADAGQPMAWIHHDGRVVLAQHHLTSA